MESTGGKDGAQFHHANEHAPDLMHKATAKESAGCVEGPMPRRPEFASRGGLRFAQHRALLADFALTTRRKINQTK